MRVNAHSAPRQSPRDFRIGPNAAVRLDVVQHPYGPVPAALEALSSPPGAPCPVLASRLRKLLSEVYQVPVEAIILLDGADRALARIVSHARRPLVGCPPSAAASFLASTSRHGDVLSIARGAGKGGSIDLDTAADLPVQSVAIVDSPSDPLGSVLSPLDVVRLARACRCLVIDERYAEVAGLSALPISLEFENIVILRSFEMWAGIQHPNCAWAVSSPRMAQAIGLEETALDPRAAAAAIETLGQLESVSLTLTLVRQERSRLYRFLRKLSFLEPMPSWGPFVPARVNLVPLDSVVDGLSRRGVYVHAPPQPGLEQIVRIGLGSRSAMDRLRNALLELAPELVA